MHTLDEPVRWGILGTAGIAESAFLPALQQTGDGVAVVVGSRDPSRAKAWAAEHGVARGTEGYEQVVADPEIEAVYIPLPNGLHAEWTIAALETGKAVFCEKPLCGTVEETERVLATAQASTGPLWEAFVFPFHEQMDRVRQLLDDGTIGRVREIESRFHYRLIESEFHFESDEPPDLRSFAELTGGSIQDVGCYPIRLARLLFDAEPDLTRAIADAEWIGRGADTELWGALAFPEDRRLMFSCGFRSGYDTFSRVLGTEGEIRMTNPFHPEEGDQLIVMREDEVQTQPAAPAGERSFTSALRHIQRAIRGLEPPRHLAVDEAMGNSTAIDALLNAARSHA